MRAPRVIGPVSEVEVIARGSRVRCRAALNRHYGHGNWRKMKGLALVEDEWGARVFAEVHWYEAHGIGTRDLKIKRVISEDV